MPTSVSLFDEWIREWFRVHPYSTYMDIGPGMGKYGKMLREMYPQARLIGIEIEPEYVEPFHLFDTYDEVLVLDALEYFGKKPGENWDVVILGDVIEHMWKSRGLDLLHFLIYRTRYMLLTYPTAYTQGPWEGHVYEAHLSTWGDQDWENYEYQHYRQIGDNNIEHNLVVLRGFRAL